MTDPSNFQQLRTGLINMSVDNCKADADLEVMRKIGRRVREEEEDTGRPVFFRQAPVNGHFSYFRPTNFSFYDKLLNRDKRNAKEFEYLNSSGTWLQLADASLSILSSSEAPKTHEEYMKYLYAIRKCVMGALEVQGARYQYFINCVKYGHAEAKLIAELGERRHEPVLSQIMNDVQETLGDKRIHEMVKILSKRQAEKAVRGTQKAPTEASAKKQ